MMPTSTCLQVHRDGPLAVLEFDPVGQPFTRVLLRAIVAAAEAAAADGLVEVLLVRSRSPLIFCRHEAGDAPATESAARWHAAAGQALLERFCRLNCITAAWLTGMVFGPGLELALACDYRYALNHPDTALGFLGLSEGEFPAHGGITRLVRLIGAANAVELLTSNEPWSARQAQQRGLVEAAFNNIVELRNRLERLCKRPFKPAHWRTPLDGWAARRVAAAYRHWRAARWHTLAARALDVVPLAATSAPLGYAAERGAYAEACTLPHFAAMRKLREHELALQVGTSASGAGIVPARKLHDHELAMQSSMGMDQPALVAVCGPLPPVAALAAQWALRGTEVRLCNDDADEQSLRAAFQNEIARGRITRAQSDQAALRVQPTQGAPAGWADLVLITAATARNLEIAEHWPGAPLLAVVNGRLKPLLNWCSRPGGVLGLNLSDDWPRVAEIIEPDAAASGLTARLRAWLARLGITPLVIGRVPGSWLRMLQNAYWDEAVRLVAEQVPIELVDRAARELGADRGPLEQLDGIGLRRASRRLLRLKPLLAAGIYGRPHTEGFYLLNADAPAAANPIAQLVLMEAVSGNTNLPRIQAEVNAEAARHVCRERLRARLLIAAIKLLGRDPRAGPAEVDVAIARGLGIGMESGGLLRHADARGLPRIVKDLRDLQLQYGEQFRPPADLVRRAAAEEPFHGDDLKPAEPPPLKLIA